MFNMARTVVLVLGAVLFCGAQNVEERAQETICQVFDTCSSCVLGDSGCMWCFQKDFSSYRCSPKSLLVERGCAEGKIFVNTQNTSTIEIDSNKDFNDVTNPDNLEDSVQIKPQRFSVKLHPKQPLTFQFKYRLAKNYPLDLYYLMDLTVTMAPDVATMAKLGRELTELLQELTQHYRVAFGYYSDKVAMPFSRTAPPFLENPCVDRGEVCRPAFDFIHSLNFTSKADEFIKKVSESKTTSNLDNLEGGFDALYQIILCEDYIHWRRNSRRIIVIATDGLLHYAGDGILAGSVRRNPSECLLDENGVYGSSLVYDYPSLEEIYHRLVRHKMNVLFAAKEDAFEYYKRLSELISDVSYVGKLEKESSNVLNLVREGYFSFIQSVKFTANASEHLKITYQSNCNQKRAWNASSMCDNVEEGKEYTFDVTLEVVDPPPGFQKETVVIEEQNIHEKLVIDVEYVGKCSCEQEVPNPEAKCSNHGTFRCGICECEEGWKGDSCEEDCRVERIKECREIKEGVPSVTCHERGYCNCGKCICDEEYTGKYCQELQCSKNKLGQVCSGRLHGTCQNGACRCKPLYTGDDCSCPVSTKNCAAPGSTEVCSGVGNCSCGSCSCDPGHSGSYCEVCSECTEAWKGLCGIYEGCVLDTVTANGTSPEKCFSKDGNVFKTEIVATPLPDNDPTTCYVRYEQADEKVCDVYYKYTIMKDLTVKLEIYSKCNAPMKAGFYIAIIIAAILGAGIIIIIVWKAKVMNDDRREYARFQEEIKKNKHLEHNPLYNSPIRQYEMPIELQQRH